MIAAGLIAAAGAAMSLTPAQAAPVRIAPAIADQAQETGIQQVHRRRGHHAYHHPYAYRKYSHYRPVYRKRYRPHYYSYYPYPYYRQPSVDFSFSFGGGHRGYHGW
jgi:hypothetical protein